MLDRLTDWAADLCLALLLLGTLAGLGAWELIRSADDAAAASGTVHLISPSQFIPMLKPTGE